MTTLFSKIKEVTELAAISGHEAPVRAYLREKLTPHVDEVVTPSRRSADRRRGAEKTSAHSRRIYPWRPRYSGRDRCCRPWLTYSGRDSRL